MLKSIFGFSKQNYSGASVGTKAANFFVYQILVVNQSPFFLLKGLYNHCLKYVCVNILQAFPFGLSNCG